MVKEKEFAKYFIMCPLCRSNAGLHDAYKNPFNKLYSTLTNAILNQYWGNKK